MKKQILMVLFGLSLIFCVRLALISFKNNSYSRMKYEQDLVINIKKDNERFDSVTKAVKKYNDSFYNTTAGKNFLKNKYNDSVKISLKEIKEAKELAIKEEKNAIKEAIETKKEILYLAKLKKIMDKYDCSQFEAIRFLYKDIWIGMSIAMVRSYRGLPNSVHISNVGNGDEYQACWEGYQISCFYYKDNGIVTAYN